MRIDWSRIVLASAVGCAVAIVGALGVSSSLAAAELPAAESIDFARDIRPILSNRCFQCHGPDDSSREADLRLDSREGLFASRDGRSAIVPGEATASELYLRATSTDPDRKMPPPDSGLPALTDREVDILRRWIEQGAAWREHWSFVTPQRPAVPATPPGLQLPPGWPRNEIDQFLLAELAQKLLTPNAEAPREALLRRVTYDLTGLPPTLEEIDAFLADDSPEAYERVVDRLLASPRYGEQMAREWLDVARYGDTHGLHLDNIRSLWPYRDWLIRAFNENRPFDQMTIEQLAGDLLESPTRDQRVATGFNRCNITTSEGGSIPEEFHVRYTVDRVETIGTVYLGLTLGCAVCHEHKFDPISQEEFYGLYAFFNSFQENPMDGNALLPPPVLEVPTDEQLAQREQLQARLAAAQTRLDEAISRIEYVDPQATATAADLPAAEFVWIDDAAPEGATLQQAGHPWKFISAPAPVLSGQNATMRTAMGLGQHFFTGAKSPLVIGEGDILFAHVWLDPENPPREVVLQFNDGSWEHRAFWGENLIDWGQNDSPARRRQGELPEAGRWIRLEVPAAQVGLGPGAKVHGWAFTQFDGTCYWDRAGIVTRTPQAGQGYDSQRAWELAVGEGGSLPQPVKDALKTPVEQRTDEQRQTLRRHFLEHVYPPSRTELSPLMAERDQAQSQLEALNNAIPRTMVVEELPQPKPAHLLIRGEYDKPGAPAARHTPAALPPFPADAPQNRLGFARWLVDRSHPLTARVTVNRWWQKYFGTGLVKTTEDFGSQGEAPSHPQLLDWLAVELMESGWDVKRLQKRIVMSAAYRQSARTTPEKLAADPANRYLARGPRFRLDAEAIRDTALVVAGLLNGEIGGPSVKPYQPGGLWEAVGYTDSNTARFQQDDGAKLYRRSLYTFWKRTSHPPSMALFDAPSREACTVRRSRTNTPLQALALMNDRQYVEASRAFAQRILAEGGTTTEARLAWGFRLTTGRRPAREELAVLARFVERQQAEFAAAPEAATQFIDSATTLLKPNHLDRDKSRDPELAAWTLLANLLLNLDETVTKG